MILDEALDDLRTFYTFLGMGFAGGKTSPRKAPALGNRLVVLELRGQVKLSRAVARPAVRSKKSN